MVKNFKKYILDLRSGWAWRFAKRAQVPISTAQHNRPLPMPSQSSLSTLMFRIQISLMGTAIASIGGCSSLPSKENKAKIPFAIARERQAAEVNNKKALVFQNHNVLDLLLGKTISKRLDAADKWHVQRAIIDTPIGQEEVWLNHISNVRCLVRPLNDYTLHHKERCRYVLVSTISNGHEEQVYPVFCYVAGARWKIED